MFNGEGGDQVFGGWANKPMIAAELYAGDDYDRLAAYMETFHRFYGTTDRLYTSAARQRLRGEDASRWVYPALNSSRFNSLLHRLRSANLLLKGAQNIAPRATQIAAASGLRVRSPFFDRELADWAFSLPTNWLLRGTCEKYLLKRVAECYLPNDVVWREKRGMGVPVTEWCRGPIKGYLKSKLSRRRLKDEGWFDFNFVESLKNGSSDLGMYRQRRLGENLWALLMLHLWIDVHGKKELWQASRHRVERGES